MNIQCCGFRKLKTEPPVKNPLISGSCKTLKIVAVKAKMKVVCKGSIRVIYCVN